MNSGKLRNRIDYYAKVKSENDFGEVTYNYSKIGSVWAQITPVSGKTEDWDSYFSTLYFLSAFTCFTFQHGEVQMLLTL